ncbi:hypothetical protein JW960_12620 [candidate division KSB1 bacterium]|nr:hypothetical protein [candidate division KSB1 bacterium]
MFRFIRILYILLCFTSASYAQQLSLRTSVRGYESGMTMSAGLYKAYINGFFCFRKLNSTPIFHPKHESALYRWLILKSLTPHYIVVQATAYPTAMSSSYLETYHVDRYRQIELNGWNWLHSLSGNAEEPHAFSILLGNFAFMGYRESLENGTTRLRQSGSGMAGFLITTGPWHILDNIRIDDRWWQAELILTGLLNEERVRNMQWNFRAGIKWHDHPLLKDVILISLFRDYTDWRGWTWSLMRNSTFNYEAQFPLRLDGRRGRFSNRQLLTFAKKIPFTIGHRNVAFRFGGGVLLEVVRKYDHEMREFELQNQRQLIWLIQPGVEF